MRDVFDPIVKPGELRCRGFSNVGNGDSEKPTRKRQGSGAFDRLNRFGGVLFTKNTRRFLGA